MHHAFKTWCIVSMSGRFAIKRPGFMRIPVFFWFYVNSWGRAKIEKLEIVSECESSGTIFMYYRTEFFS